MKKYNGELIFHQRDGMGDVEVVDGPQLRTLHFGTPVIQSSMYIHDPFALEMEYNRVMMLSLLFNPSPQAALFLGLGGGSKPKFLWKHFPACHVDAVEYNPAVIDVCYRYFGLPHDARLTIYPDEAFHFLHGQNPRQYDFIYLDLYVDSGMSTTVGENHFFEACFDRLAPGGLLVWNLWRTSAKELIEQSVGNLARLFAKNMLILTVQESLNFVVFAFKPPVPALSLQDAIKRVEALSKHTGTDFATLFASLNYFQGLGFLFQEWE